MKRSQLHLLCAVALAFVRPVWAVAAEPFELMDGERVVFLGNTLIERDQEYGYLETALTSRWPDRNITFRNLGWSGDTVWGDARAGFDNAERGFQRLKELVLANKPTTIVVSYGTNESFAGEKGLPDFQKGLDRLLDAIGESKARIVIVTPIAQEDQGRPLPDPTEQNVRLKLYCHALEVTAKKRNLEYIDVFLATRKNKEMTNDGMHLNGLGYWAFARAIKDQLNLSEPKCRIRISAANDPSGSQGIIVTGVERNQLGCKFKAQDNRMTSCVAPCCTSVTRELRVEGLKPGVYSIKIDGTDIGCSAADDELAKGWKYHPQIELDQAEKLRAAINAKNKLYFYRWRPQNETYLFGFRKHEQGKNAAEVVQFDPLIAEKEAEIAKLRVPQPHVYELVKEPDEKK